MEVRVDERAWGQEEFRKVIAVAAMKRIRLVMDLGLLAWNIDLADNI